MLVVFEMVEFGEAFVGLHLEWQPIVVKELKFLQFHLGLVHSLNLLVHNPIIIAHSWLAVMHQVIEHIHNRILAFLFGLHAHLRVFAEIDQMRYPVLLYLKLKRDELMSRLALLHLCLFELCDVLVILILTLSLNGQLIPEDEVLPLALEVFPGDMLHEGVLAELLLADHLEEEFLRVLEELLVVDWHTFVEFLFVGALGLVDVA